MDSFLPYEGKVKFISSNTTELQFEFRDGLISKRLKPRSITDGCLRYDLNGRYLEFEMLNAGDEIAISFPIASQVIKYIRTAMGIKILVVKTGKRYAAS